MLRLFAATIVFLGSVLVPVCTANAQISIITENDTAIFSFDGDAGNNVNPFSQDGNGFEQLLTTNGFNYLLSDADVSFDSDGIISFELIGSTLEGGGRDSILINQSLVFSQAAPFAQDFTNGTSLDGLLLSEPIAVAAGVADLNLLTFQRTNSRGRNQRNRNYENSRFGIFVSDINSLSNLSEVVFAFERHGRNNRFGQDFDEFLVRATFVPVPEPGPLGLLVAALALIGWRQTARGSAK